MQGSAATKLPWVTQEALRVAAEEAVDNRKVSIEAIKVSFKTSFLSIVPTV